MTHPNEPSLEKLKEIESSLYGEESTDENMKKIKAVQSQIARHEKLVDSPVV